MWIPGDHGQLAISPSTIGPSAFLTAFRPADIPQVTPAQARELKDARVKANSASREVVFAAPIDGVNVVATDIPISTFNPDASAFMETRAGTRGVVRFWAPAVLQNDALALVRFRFGPTPHGAEGSYLLGRCDEGQWIILWTSLFYYA